MEATSARDAAPVESPPQLNALPTAVAQTPPPAYAQMPPSGAGIAAHILTTQAPGVPNVQLAHSTTPTPMHKGCQWMPAMAPTMAHQYQAVPHMFPGVPQHPHPHLDPSTHQPATAHLSAPPVYDPSAYSAILPPPAAAHVQPQVLHNVEGAVTAAPASLPAAQAASDAGGAAAGDTDASNAQKRKREVQRWSNAEEAKLKDAVLQLGTDAWSLVANEVVGRTARQCKEHYLEVIGPEVKRGEWGSDEEERLVRLHAQYGSAWARISKDIPGRPPNTCKNKFNGTWRRKECPPSMLSEYIRHLISSKGSVQDANARIAALTHAEQFKVPPTAAEAKVARVALATTVDSTPATSAVSTPLRDNGGGAALAQCVTHRPALHVAPAVFKAKLEVEEEAGGNGRGPARPVAVLATHVPRSEAGVAAVAEASGGPDARAAPAAGVEQLGVHGGGGERRAAAGAAEAGDGTGACAGAGPRGQAPVPPAASATAEADPSVQSVQRSAEESAGGAAPNPLGYSQAASLQTVAATNVSDLAAALSPAPSTPQPTPEAAAQSSRSAEATAAAAAACAPAVTWAQASAAAAPAPRAAGAAPAAMVGDAQVGGAGGSAAAYTAAYTAAAAAAAAPPASAAAPAAVRASADAGAGASCPEQATDAAHAQAAPNPDGGMVVWPGYMHGHMQAPPPWPGVWPVGPPPAAAPAQPRPGMPMAFHAHPGMQAAAYGQQPQLSPGQMYAYAAYMHGLPSGGVPMPMDAARWPGAQQMAQTQATQAWPQGVQGRFPNLPWAAAAPFVMPGPAAYVMHGAGAASGAAPARGPTEPQQATASVSAPAKTHPAPSSTYTHESAPAAAASSPAAQQSAGPGGPAAVQQAAPQVTDAWIPGWHGYTQMPAPHPFAAHARGGAGVQGLVAHMPHMMPVPMGWPGMPMPPAYAQQQQAHQQPLTHPQQQAPPQQQQQPQAMQAQNGQMAHDGSPAQLKSA